GEVLRQFDALEVLRHSLELRQPRDVARQHVDLEVHRIARAKRTEAGYRGSVRDDVHTESVVRNLVDRQRYPVHSDAPLDSDEACEGGGNAKPPARRAMLRYRTQRLAHPVDMAGDEMTSQLVAQPQRTLQIDRRTRLPASQCRSAEGFRRGI